MKLQDKTKTLAVSKLYPKKRERERERNEREKKKRNYIWKKSLNTIQVLGLPIPGS